MTTALFLIIAGILIGAGMSVIWRDVQKNRRRAFVSERDARAGTEPDVEITIAPVDGNESVSRTAMPAAAPLTEAPPEPPRPTRDPADPTPQTTHPSLEQQWESLQPAIMAGVDKVNAVLDPTRLMVGTSGEPAWSYKNRGYGAYRRVLLGEDSVGWLRLELTPDGRLNASIKAHKDDHAVLNASASTPSEGMNAARASDLLSQCLRPAVSFAAQAPASPEAERRASEGSWRNVETVVTAALKAANGALAQAGARLVPLGPAAWEADLRRHRMTLSVEVNAEDVARMHIERLPHEIEVAVGVREAHMIDLGRRRRIAVEGMTIHAMAELVASCAWPTIARFREHRRPA